MILCTHCQAKNSVDSAFCKSCGREVSETDREQARQENAKLIAEGYSLLAEGRTEEAELVARAAIEADQNAAGAYSLLGMCHERQDDVVAALECYEKVVELNPDSSLDKIKVTQLRNVLARRADAEPAAPSRKMALAGAMACVVLVGAIGAITALLAQPVETKAAEKKDQRSNLLAENSQAFGQVPNEYRNVPQNGGGQYNPQNDQANGGANGTGLEGAVNNSNAGGNNNQASSGSKNYYNSGNQGGNNNYTGPGRPNLPSVGDTNPQEEIPPWRPPGTTELVKRPDGDDPGEVKNQNNGSGGTTTATGEDPKPQDNTPKKPVGSITITQVGNGNGNQRNDDPQDEGTSLKALVRTADQQFLTGNYDSAARSLEQAKSRGGDSGSVNKKLALCYEKLGKRSDAIQAYRSAKKQLESKAGNDPVAKSQLESVNQALKNLGG